MRYISLCASSDDVTSEVASILAKFVGTPGISSAGNKILRYLRFLRRRKFNDVLMNGSILTKMCLYFGFENCSHEQIVFVCAKEWRS